MNLPGYHVESHPVVELTITVRPRPEDSREYLTGLAVGFLRGAGVDVVAVTTPTGPPEEHHPEPEASDLIADQLAAASSSAVAMEGGPVIRHPLDLGPMIPATAARSMLDQVDPDAGDPSPVGRLLVHPDAARILSQPGAVYGDHLADDDEPEPEPTVDEQDAAAQHAADLEAEHHAKALADDDARHRPVVGEQLAALASRTTRAKIDRLARELDTDDDAILSTADELLELDLGRPLSRSERHALRVARRAVS